MTTCQHTTTTHDGWWQQRSGGPGCKTWMTTMTWHAKLPVSLINNDYQGQRETRLRTDQHHTATDNDNDIVSTHTTTCNTPSHTMTVLFTAPQIPAGMTGFHWNPVEWDRNPQESSGIGPESSGICRTPTGIHRNGCIPAGMGWLYIYVILFILFIFNNLHLLFNLIVIYI